MPKVSPIQSSFNAGEFSPLLYGRVDSDRYKAGLATCLNYIPTIQGGLTRRPGTMYVSEVKDNSLTARLMPFEFSTTQAYMLEFGNQYIRFFKDNAIITNTAVNITNATQASPVVITSNAHGFSNGDRVVITGVSGMVELNNREFVVAGVTANTFNLTLTGSLANVDGTGYTAYTSGGTAAEVYEISSPYLTADLFEIKYTQSADVLYLVHPDYAPRKLTRTGHTAWTLSVIDFLDGPYLPTVSDKATLTPSASTGSGVTVTASSTSGINNDTGFQTTDVGRLIRMKEGSTWGYCEITGRTSTTVVTVTVINTLTNTNPKTSWRLGVWSDTTGYPQTVNFHEDRLFFGGPEDYPQRLDGSRSGDYENFAPSDTDGTITSSHAVSFSFNSNDVNMIRWITSDEKGLLAGTVGGEWVTRPSSQSEALSPTNITAKKTTSYGSANIQPVQSGKATLFVQRAQRKVREMTYFFDVDGFRASDVTVLAEHISESGIVQLAYQKEPQSLVWAVRDDGVLACMTYERDLDAVRVGWSRHILGGYSDLNESAPQVESVAVIPSPDGTREEVWLVVKRYVNGKVRRFVEYMTKIFQDDDEQRAAYFVDGGLTYDDPKSFTAITASNPAVVTHLSVHGYSNGDQIVVTNAVGMEELNGQTFTVANKTAFTYELLATDTSGYAASATGGETRKYVTQVSGLFHLEGETVQLLCDGAVQPDVTVSGGKITLTHQAATVHIGYSYNSDGQLLRLEAGAADGTAIGKTRRIHRIGFLLHRTLGLAIGPNFDSLTQITFRTAADPMTRAPALFSGILSETIDSDYDFENQLCWRQSQPLPSTILAVMPQLITQDRG